MAGHSINKKLLVAALFLWVVPLHFSLFLLCLQLLWASSSLIQNTVYSVQRANYSEPFLLAGQEGHITESLISTLRLIDCTLSVYPKSQSYGPFRNNRVSVIWEESRCCCQMSSFMTSSLPLSVWHTALVIMKGAFFRRRNALLISQMPGRIIEFHSSGSVMNLNWSDRSLRLSPLHKPSLLNSDNEMERSITTATGFGIIEHRLEEG